MTHYPTDIYTNTDLLKISKNKEVNSDIIIRGENIKRLDKVEIINGSLGICDSSLQSLGTLKKVTGNLFISTHTVYSNIITLNNIEIVGGDLSLRYTNIESLGALKEVGGQLSLRDTKIDNLGKLTFVGGNLFLPKRLNNAIDLTKITVKGKIRFWNDSKTVKTILPKCEMGYCDYKNIVPYWRHKYIHSFRVEFISLNEEQLRFYQDYKTFFLDGKYIDINGNDNYSFILFYDFIENHNSDVNKLQGHLNNLSTFYPKTKQHVESKIVDLLESVGDFETSWDNISKETYINIKDIIEYESKLNRELLTGELIIKIAGFSHLTEFGQNNIDKIQPCIDKQLIEYKEEKKSKFFDLFIKANRPINILHIVKDKATYEYDSKYYENFFLSKTEYNYYKAIDESQIESGYINPLPHVVEKAILNQCRLIIKRSEDAYRESIGMPRVGEGWISETELFYKISEHFNDEEVIQHASPEWLGRQHLDIYFPKLNIGIEYQGAQHYEPIEFFGGQEAFEKTQERDARKKELCREFKCHLICVEKGYDLMEIVNEIENKRCTTKPKCNRVI